MRKAACELHSWELRTLPGDLELSHLSRHTEYIIRCLSEREIDATGCKLRLGEIKRLDFPDAIQLKGLGILFRVVAAVGMVYSRGWLKRAEQAGRPRPMHSVLWELN